MAAFAASAAGAFVARAQARLSSNSLCLCVSLVQSAASFLLRGAATPPPVPAAWPACRSCLSLSLSLSTSKRTGDDCDDCDDYEYTNAHTRHNIWVAVVVL